MNSTPVFDYKYFTTAPFMELAYDSAFDQNLSKVCETYQNLQEKNLVLQISGFDKKNFTLAILGVLNNELENMYQYYLLSNQYIEIASQMWEKIAVILAPPIKWTAKSINLVNDAIYKQLREYHAPLEEINKITEGILTATLSTKSSIDIKDRIPLKYIGQVNEFAENLNNILADYTNKSEKISHLEMIIKLRDVGSKHYKQYTKRILGQGTRFSC